MKRCDLEDIYQLIMILNMMSCWVKRHITIIINLPKISQISTLKLQWLNTDTLTCSTTETLSSRLQMEEPIKFAISINYLWPLEPSTTTNHGISKLKERPMIFKSIAPTHNGSRFSNMRKTVRYLMFQKPCMRNK